MQRDNSNKIKMINHSKLPLWTNNGQQGGEIEILSLTIPILYHLKLAKHLFDVGTSVIWARIFTLRRADSIW